MDLKKDPTVCCLHKTHLIEKDIYRLKVKEWKKTYNSHGLSKKAGVSIFISDKVDFKPMLVRRDKEGHFILLKGSISQEDVMIINIYSPNRCIHVCQTNPSQFQELNKPQHNNTR